MGKIEMSHESMSRQESAGFDMEARWRGELAQQERKDIKAWAKKAATWGKCELKIGKERSRLVMIFDRKKLEQRSREHIGYIETMLRAQQEQLQDEAAQALEGMRTAPIESATGLLVKDYGSVLARDWATQTSASLQALIPARCGLKVQLGASLIPVLVETVKEGDLPVVEA
jgi:hypothetical protein